MHNILIWSIAAVSILLVLLRPKRWPEAIWSALGAGLLVLLQLVPVASATAAIAKGTDVYLFLIGMMIVAELARQQGVFEWLAVHAVGMAKGSRTRLFAIVYGVGVLVTVFLSNDATAVVLTPAVLATTRAAKAKPLPYLMICAFIANAASFVLPMSNPANLVVYRAGMPPLLDWLAAFALPSLLAIAVTYAGLYFMSRPMLQGPLDRHVEEKPLSSTGKITVGGIVLLVVTLLAASAMGEGLGAPACAAAVIASAAVAVRSRKAAFGALRHVSWSVLPLVAGLFVIIEGINSAGALDAAVTALHSLQAWPPVAGIMAAGFGVAGISNLMNNLPSGLIGGAAVVSSGITGPLRDAVLIGVDLGPNISVTGSLATILWLIALRREDQHVGFWEFLKWGAVITPPALALSLLALLA